MHQVYRKRDNKVVSFHFSAMEAFEAHAKLRLDLYAVRYAQQYAQAREPIAVDQIERV